MSLRRWGCGLFLAGIVAGVAVLGSAIDPAAPFAIAYGDLASVTRALSVGTATQATAHASAQVTTPGVQNPPPCPPPAASPCPCAGQGLFILPLLPLPGL